MGENVASSHPSNKLGEEHSDINALLNAHSLLSTDARENG